MNHSEQRANPKDNDASLHPMVSVPDAIRRALRETAITLWEATAVDSYWTEKRSVYDDLTGRCLAEDVIMPPPGYPPYAASIMDGYCVRTKDIDVAVEHAQKQTPDNPVVPTHRIVDKVHAGDGAKTVVSETADTTLPPACYITTGAKLPEGYDAVVPLEDIRIIRRQDGDQASTMGWLAIDSDIISSLKPNKWIRPPGCDLEPESTVLHKGTPLWAVERALLRQTGQSHVLVEKRLKVGVISTGNELIVSDDSGSSSQNHWNLHSDGAEHGRIPDVNRTILLGLLQEWNALHSNVEVGDGLSIETVDLGVGRDDDVNALADCLQTEAACQCDVILTTGGISRGDTDIMEEVLVNKMGGQLSFGRLHMKPGKPTTLVALPPTAVRPRRCLVFALPGNPVSAAVCSHLLVYPCLLMLNNQRYERQHFDRESYVNHVLSHARVHTEVVATLKERVKLDQERPEYRRVTLEPPSSDALKRTWRASSTGVQRSSRLASLRGAVGVIVLPQANPPNVTHTREDESFNVLLLEPAATRALWRGHLEPSLIRPLLNKSKHCNSIETGDSETTAKHPNQHDHSCSHANVVLKAPLQIELVQWVFSDNSDGITTEDLLLLSEKIRTSLEIPGKQEIEVTWKRQQFVSNREMLEASVDKEGNVMNDKDGSNPDIVLWVTSSIKDDSGRGGCFAEHSRLAQLVRNQRWLHQSANAMELAIRQGASHRLPFAGAWESVIRTSAAGPSTASGSRGFLFVLLSDQGIEEALSHTRKLLGHVIRTLRAPPSLSTQGQ